MRFAKVEAQNRIGSGIYSTPLQSVYMRELKSIITTYRKVAQPCLAISVHARVEISGVKIFGDFGSVRLQSVYMRELKWQ